MRLVLARSDELIVATLRSGHAPILRVVPAESAQMITDGPLPRSAPPSASESAVQAGSTPLDAPAESKSASTKAAPAVGTK